jgi:hypothetical protein
MNLPTAKPGNQSKARTIGLQAEHPQEAKQAHA